MRQYPDPQEYFDQRMNQAAERYVSGLRKNGLKNNDRLARAVAERMSQQVHDQYLLEANETLEHNVGYILEQHRQEDNKIKRSGRRWGTLICLPATLLFGLIAWYSHVHPAGFIPNASLIYGLASLAFLILLVCGNIFNRPK